MQVCRSIACIITLAAAVFSGPVSECAQPLLRVGHQITTATFVRFDEDDTIQFRIDDQQSAVTHRELIRWGTPQATRSGNEVILVDGSRIVLADAWTGQPNWQTTAKAVSLRTRLLGDLSFPVEKLRAVVLNAPTDVPRRAKLVDQLIASRSPRDRIVMVNGDLLDGRLDPISRGADGVTITIGEQGEPIVVPFARVAGIAFNRESEKPASGTLIVGLRDCALVYASALAGGPREFDMTTVCGIELTGIDLADVVYLRSTGAATVYLSDLSPAAYRHVPYLDLPWPLGVDQNALGLPLAVGGRIYPKGLGMHTASRVTYDLTKHANRHRLVASVAVDDAAVGRGSVIFRVYLQRAGEWHSAYTSPIVRGGDEPVPVTVELEGATQIALVSDYADRGDERDYANWLDARLE